MVHFSEIQYEIKNILRKVRDFLIKRYPKPLDKMQYEGSKLYVSKENVDYIYKYTSSTVVVITIGDKKKYFRECERHTSKKKYFEDFTDFYFEFVASEDNCVKVDKDRIFKNLDNYKNRKKFFELKKIIDLNDLYSPRFVDLDLRKIGLDVYGDEEYKARLRPYIMYASTKVINYSLNNYIGSKNTYHSFFSNKTIAYQEMAKLLDVEYLVPFTEYMILVINNKPLFGFVMDQAPGIRGEDISIDDRNSFLSPIIQRDFSNMSILDYLCLIRDHKTRNFNVLQGESGFFEGISCFDNNEPSAFDFSSCVFFEDYRGCSCIVNNGLYYRPFIEKKMFSRIMEIRNEDIIRTLNNFLQRKQILSVCERLNVLKDAIAESLKNNLALLISDDQWSYETIKTELSGNYGKTYLSCFISETI